MSIETEIPALTDADRKWFAANVEDVLGQLFGTAVRLCGDRTEAERPRCQRGGQGVGSAAVARGQTPTSCWPHSSSGPRAARSGLDMTAAMRAKCLANAEQMELGHVEVLDGNAEAIPLPDASVDVVTSNGVINLVPEKDKAASEIHRVLRPGGRVQISDVVVRDLLSAACRSEPELWAECVVGATTESDYIQKLESAGLTDVGRISELDYFAVSNNESTKNVARGFGAYSVTLKGTKPIA